MSKRHSLPLAKRRPTAVRATAVGSGEGLLPRRQDRAMYKTFDHTADVGLRVEAASLDELFAEAGRGLLAVILGDVREVRSKLSRQFRIDGTDLAYLLVDWLNELLFAFESQHLLLAEFDVHLDGHGLVATGWGEEVDETRHRLQREVKAITYHGLFVSKLEGIWTAEVILDI